MLGTIRADAPVHGKPLSGQGERRGALTNLRSVASACGRVWGQGEMREYVIVKYIFVWRPPVLLRCPTAPSDGSMGQDIEHPHLASLRVVTHTPFNPFWRVRYPRVHLCACPSSLALCDDSEMLPAEQAVHLSGASLYASLQGLTPDLCCSS